MSKCEINTMRWYGDTLCFVRSFELFQSTKLIMYTLLYTRTRTYDHIRSSIVHKRTDAMSSMMITLIIKHTETLCRRCSNEIHGGRLSFTHSPLKLDELRPRLRRVVYTRSLPRARDGDRNHYALWVRDPRLCAHSNTGAEEFTSRSACTRISFRLERPSVFI